MVELLMADEQLSFTDVEYGMRRRQTRRERFLDTMDCVVPWQEWVALIEPFYYNHPRGRKAVPLETILRMYLLQAWFSLSDEGVEDAVNDSYAMRRFMRLDFTRQQVPDATTLLHFRHLLEKHRLGEAMFRAQQELFDANGWVMRGGTVVDATIIAAPPSVKNRDKGRDPEMHQTRKGSQWYFGMKAHIGADAGTGYVHSVSVTAANVADVTEAASLVRDDDEVVWADAGYQGIGKRDEVTVDDHLSKVEFRVAPRAGTRKTMPLFDQHLDSRQASVRAKVEHPFLIVKRDFGFIKTRYRGLAKNLHHLQVLVASANLLMRGRAIHLMAAGLR